MDTDLLENFIVLAQYRNFSEAAEQLFISQSTLSKRIKRLEEQMGLPLVTRTTKHVELNEYGETLLTYAKKMLALEAECHQALQAKLPDGSNKLVIGAIPSLANYQLTQLISSFMAVNHLDIQVITAPSEDLEQMLHDQRCDAAFIRQVYDPENLLIKRPILSDQLVAVVPVQHPLAQKQTLEIKALKKEAFVFQPKGSRPYNMCVYLCKKNGFSPNVIFMDAHISNIIDFVSKGLGISLLMEKTTTDMQTDQVKIIPITPAVEQTVALCLVKNQTLSYSQKALMSFVETYKK